MTAAWVAGTVRSRALLQRRIGPAAAAEIARAPTFGDALARVAASPYRRFLPEHADPAQAERALADGVLWHLRILGGWLPWPGTTALRVLVADFEIRNIADRLRAQTGGSSPPPYELGVLATAWRRASTAGTPAELRRALAGSAWGDPGPLEPGALVADLRLAAAARLAAVHAVTRPWGAAAAALAVARRRFLIGRAPPPSSAQRVRALLGTRALDAGEWAAFTAALSADAGWPLAGIEEPRELWRAEERWWERVEREAQELARPAEFALEPALGCAVLLLADARAARRALAVAGRGGPRTGGGDGDA